MQWIYVLKQSILNPVDNTRLVRHYWMTTDAANLLILTNQKKYNEYLQK